MSLFGTQSSAAKSGSSLFGTTPASNTTSSGQQQGSLFGTTANNQAGSSASLFGSKLAPLNITSANQASSATGGSGLFDNATATSSSGGGLFGTANPSTSTSGGLFGGQSSQQAASTQSQSASLFGSTAAATQTPAKSLFGAANTASQPQSDPLFGAAQSSTANNTLTQTQHAASDDPSQMSRTSDAPKAAIFDDILERGKKRRDISADAPQGNQLPALQMSLGDLSSKIRGLGAAKPDFGASRAQDSRAQYLLAASGVPQGATRRDLDAFSSRSGTSSQPVTSSFDPDMENYMNNVHAKTTMDMLNESMAQSRRDFDIFVEDNIQINWTDQRRRIYEHFGLVKPSDDQMSTPNPASIGPTERGAFGKSSRRARGLEASGNFGQSSSGRSSASRSILGGSVQRASVRQQTLFPDMADKFASAAEQNSAMNDPYLRSKQEGYMEKVQELNRARVEGQCYPVAHRFAAVESANADTPQHLKGAYRALVEIVGELPDSVSLSEIGAVRPRQFAKEYLDDSSNPAAGLSIRRRILEGSRKHLENEYFKKIEKVVEENAREADIGGVPTKINKVRGYVRIRANRRDLTAEDAFMQRSGDDYLWALIFHLLRCGLLKEAAQYVAENEAAVANMDRFFPGYLQLYVKHDRNVPLKERMSMGRIYQQRTLQPENSVDAYRMACYKVMGRCELNRKNLEGINQSIEDLIWLYFSLARETNKAEETAGEVFGLEEVRQLIEDIGERHFSSGLTEGGPGYGVYFLMQILSGMFEKSIEWLYRYNYVAAVHFAIVLDYYGLLRVADFSVGDENLLTYTTREKPQLSFGRLVGYYTRDFRLARTEAASDYLILVCLNDDLPGGSGKTHSQMCHEALKELVLETREFALLLGDVRSDGSRIPGAIQRRLSLFAGKAQDQNEFLRTLTIQAAATADDSGRTTDAVLLYHLAEDFESVISIVSRALSDALSVDIGEEQMQLQPLKPRADLQGDTASAANEPESLSLTAISDPTELARSMVNLYHNNALAMKTIRTATMDTANLLLLMADIKARVVQSRWAEALDGLKSLDFLPFGSQGSIAAIRLAAGRLNDVSPVVARNIGPLLVWAITACGQQRRVLQASLYEGARNALVEQLAVTARDMMVYAGLMRYRLPGDTFDMLAQAGREIGGT